MINIFEIDANSIRETLRWNILAYFVKTMQLSMCLEFLIYKQNFYLLF